MRLLLSTLFATLSVLLLIVGCSSVVLGDSGASKSAEMEDTGSKEGEEGTATKKEFPFRADTGKFVKEGQRKATEGRRRAWGGKGKGRARRMRR